MLTFDYNFIEGDGNDDIFNAFVLDSTTGGSVDPSFEFSESGTSSGSHSFDLSSLVNVGFDLGIQFELNSTNEGFPPPLDLLGSLLLLLVKRRVR